ncbi:MAG: hypothetical protein HS117_15250 [Verrucomicrobiaceae bacterium]|nr:hypothetical protein [Verrucomicrobiaceae bacterium]
MKTALSAHAQASLSAMQSNRLPLVTRAEAFGVIKGFVGNNHDTAESVWTELALEPADRDLFRVPPSRKRV